MPWSVETAQIFGSPGLTETSIGAATEGASRVSQVLPPSSEIWIIPGSSLRSAKMRLPWISISW